MVVLNQMDHPEHYFGYWLGSMWRWEPLSEHADEVKIAGDIRLLLDNISADKHDAAAEQGITKITKMSYKITIRYLEKKKMISPLWALDLKHYLVILPSIEQEGGEAVDRPDGSGDER